VAEGAGSGTPTIARARTPPAAVRLVSAGVEDALERFSDPTLLSTGPEPLIPRLTPPSLKQLIPSADTCIWFRLVS